MNEFASNSNSTNLNASYPVADNSESLRDNVNDRQSSPIESNRNHPWDSSFPTRLGKVDINNTTMDSADGVETTFTTKTGQWRNAVPSGNTGMSTMNRMRMDHEGEGSSAVHFGNQIQESDDEIANHRLSPWHHENTKAMSDDFDAAWVSLPSSTFFKPRNSQSITESTSAEAFKPYSLSEQERQRSQDKSQIPSIGTRLSTSNSGLPSSGSSMGASRFQEAAAPQGRNQKLLDVNSSSKTTTKDQSPNTNSGSPVKARGLKGFLKRKGSASRTTFDQASNNSASYNDQHSYTNTSYDESLRQKSQGGNTALTSARVDQNRGRRSASKSRSPVRGRAKSLDDRRIRNPSIARKFSRLLRVYDTEKDTAQI